MKTIGQRQEPSLTFHATGEQLAAGAQFSEAIAKLSPVHLVPKGVSRFKTHDEANRHWDFCLARSMAALAAMRSTHD